MNNNKIEYLKNLQKLYEIKKNQGVNDTDITQTEDRLKITLPNTFKEYHQTLGLADNLNHAFNHILPLAEIDFAEDYLVIAEENQQVCYWGIKKADLTQSNPPVYACYDIDQSNPKWYLENNTLADFFLMMALYNATQGGLQYDANCLKDIPKSTVSTIEQNWQEIPNVQINGTRYFTHDFNDVMILCFDENGQCNGVFTGTNQQDLFDKTLELDINWSYVSYEYEDCDDDEFE